MRSDHMEKSGSEESQQLEDLRSLLKTAKTELDVSTFHPIHESKLHRLEKLEVEQLGFEALDRGEVASIIVAGGMGTRLGWSGPKGTYPVTQLLGKSLFQLFAEKTGAASKRSNRRLHLAVMTSPLNHEVTKSYFERHDFFGLHPSQVALFQQHMIPMLDEKGETFLAENGETAFGPDGNGYALHHLKRTGVLDLWRRSGVKWITFVQVDNALADPFDASLVGFAINKKLDCAIKSIMRDSPQEKVGILVEVDGKVQVVEYSEVPDVIRLAKRKDSEKLLYPCANISSYCFSVDFVEKAATLTLPLHCAWKKVKALHDPSLNACKFEAFIFDLLPYANSEVVLYPRSLCFAPIKNSTGNNSPEDAKRALQERDRELLKFITGQPAPSHPFEVDQSFYYLNAGLKDRLRGRRSFESTYLVP